MFNIQDFELLMKYCEAFLYSLHSPFVGEKMKASHKSMADTLKLALGLRKHQDFFKIEQNDNISNQNFSNPVDDDIEHKAIYKNSDTYKRLQAFITSSSFDTNGNVNKFFNKDFAQAFLKCHLSYIFLWGHLLTAISDPFVARANNGAIENSFQMKKREAREHSNEIGKFGTIRSSR